MTFHRQSSLNVPGSRRITAALDLGGPPAPPRTPLRILGTGLHSPPSTQTDSLTLTAYFIHHLHAPPRPALHKQGPRVLGPHTAAQRAVPTKSSFGHLLFHCQYPLKPSSSSSTSSVCRAKHCKSEKYMSALCKMKDLINYASIISSTGSPAS